MVYERELQDIWKGLEPEELLPFSEAVEKNLYIPEQSTYYSLWRSPYFRWILDLIEDPEVSVISLMMAAQGGKSAFNTAIMLEYAARYANELILYYAPDIESIDKFCSTKLLPSAESGHYQKHIKKALNGTNKRTALKTNQIQFSNGSTIQALSTGSSTALVSKTSSFIVLDEYSGMKKTNRGDILSLAKARTRTKAYGNRKVIVTSTPLNSDSDIDELHKSSRQYGWEVPCPSCGEYQLLKISQLKWQKPYADIALVIEKDMLESGTIPVWYECEHCGNQIKDENKLPLLNAGREVCTGNDHLSKNQISLHLNALYGIEKWNKIASAKVESRSNPDKLKEFVTQMLAEPWVDLARTKTISNNTFNIGSLKKGELPADTYKIVCGLDVQGDRYYQVLIAYTRHNKVHLVDWAIESFDVSNPCNPESFPYRILDKTWTIVAETFAVDMLVIDTGNNADGLLPLVESLSRCQPIKGSGNSKSSRIYAWPSTAKDNIIQNLLMVDRQSTELLLDNMLHSARIVFPQSTISDPIYEHLKNVIRKDEVYVDRYKGARTDYRDALRYALTWTKFCEYAEEIEQEEYVQANKQLIEERNRMSRAILDELF